MKAKTPIEAIWATVAMRVGENREHGWGQEDSVAAICAVFEAETGDKPDEKVEAAIGMVVNPSAFRQVLEKTSRGKDKDGKELPSILAASDKKKKEKERHDNLFAQFLAADKPEEKKPEEKKPEVKKAA